MPSEGSAATFRSKCLIRWKINLFHNIPYANPTFRLGAVDRADVVRLSFYLRPLATGGSPKKPPLRQVPIAVSSLEDHLASFGADRRVGNERAPFYRVEHEVILRHLALLDALQKD